MPYHSCMSPKTRCCQVYPRMQNMAATQQWLHRRSPNRLMSSSMMQVSSTGQVPAGICLSCIACVRATDVSELSNKFSTMPPSNTFNELCDQQGGETMKKVYSHPIRIVAISGLDAPHFVAISGHVATIFIAISGLPQVLHALRLLLFI